MRVEGADSLEPLRATPVTVAVVTSTVVATPPPLPEPGAVVVVASTCAIPAFSEATEEQYSAYTPIADDTAVGLSQDSVVMQLERKYVADEYQSA
ncbi:hypothetical protein IFR05_013712 [Cadophora sp. M221]|nr:hypothetical protein IFR05_013712 [Cadophora sp. M221]